MAKKDAAIKDPNTGQVIAQSKDNWSVDKLSEPNKQSFTYVNKRISELKLSRVFHYGTNLDFLWADADRDYIPHRLKTKRGKKVTATDEDRGWRGAMVSLGTNDWQSDIAQANPFIKIQTALSIMIDQNPSGVFSATAKKFEATTHLVKQLYQRSWEYAQSKAQLKLFVFNLCKYGWACARTYPLRLTRKVKVMKEFNQEEPDKSVYEEKEVVEYNDIMRESLDPRNTWIDDMAKPNNNRSVKDWCWRKVYDMEAATQEFGNYANWKYVKKGGNTMDTINTVAYGVGNLGGYKRYQNDNLVEIYFYENIQKDLFMMIANGVPVIIDPLPITDAKGSKKLSLWQTYWNLRHAESPFGVGIYEALRYDNAMLDRVKNMTLDQLTLSIYKMFFYTGTQSLTETGDIPIVPGVGKQTLDPKNINWMEVPGPGAEAWKGIEVLQKDVDKASGITDPLQGEITGKTAFELAQAKESALKRLKTPLDNILEALNNEGYITVSLTQMLYSIPETYQISDPQLIDDYLKEIQSDPELFERSDDGSFTAKVYPEMQLNLDKDEKGNLIETKESQFFRIKPSALNWEGIINIKSESLLSSSQQIDKALDLELTNALVPIFSNPMGPQTFGKLAKMIVKAYNKDPRDVLPDMWLESDKPQEQPLFVPQPNLQQTDPATGQPMQQQPGAQPQVQAQSLSQQPTSLVGKMMSRISAPFRRV